ncbi:MAG: hypothetical protein HFJ17_03825 [Clostridia bacterium]|nr:hypothetical protein [Clostridia bacterium]
MRNSKKIILITIIVIATILILGGGIFAYTYFFTDSFLNTEQRFYKYIGKNSEIVDFFSDKSLVEYKKKLQTTSYNNNGEVTVNVLGDVDENIKKVTDELQKHKITFTGSIDSANKYFYEDVRLKYSDKDIIGGTFYHKDDYYGVMINDIIKMFITIKNDNLKEFAKKLGVTETQLATIPDKINIEDIKNKDIFTEDELKELTDRYLKVITDNLSEDMFSKSEVQEGEMYTLSINEEQAGNIAVAVINTFENDEMLVNKIKEILMQQENVTQQDVQTMIDGLKSSLESAKNEITQGLSTQMEGTNNSTLNINVYVSKRNLVKTEIDFAGESKIVLNNGKDKVLLEIIEGENTIGSVAIEKSKSDNELSYKVSVLDGENKELAKMTETYTGLSDMANVQSSILVDVYLTNILSIADESEKNILEKAQSNKKELNNATEKEQISLALLELKTKLTEDTYTSEEEFEINATTIKEAISKQNLSVSVNRNGDGTYQIISNSTGKTYNVNAQGELIENENQTTNEVMDSTANTEEIVTSKEEKGNINLSFGIKNTVTFGEIQKQEPNMYIINDKSLEQLQNMFSQLGNRISTKVISTYANTSIGNIISSQGQIAGIQRQNNNSSSNTTKAPDLSEQEKSVFNAKFALYEGESVTSTQADALIQTVITSNQAQISNGGHYVTVTFPSTSGKEQKISVNNKRITYSEASAINKVQTGKQYKITLKYKDGYVSEITIKKK